MLLVTVVCEAGDTQTCSQEPTEVYVAEKNTV